MGRKIGKRLRKAVKKHGRLHAKIASKAVKVVTPVLAAAATVFAGPAAGMAITAAGGGIARWSGATNARAQGKHGRHARKVGRKLAARTMKYGALATGAGLLGSVALGGSVFTGLAGAASSGSAAGGLGKVGMPKGGATSDNLGGVETGWDSLAAPNAVPGSGGGSDLGAIQSGWDSLYTPSPGASAPSSPAAAGNSWQSTAIGTLGALAGGYVSDPGDKGSGKPGESTTDPFNFGGLFSGDGENTGRGKLFENPLVLAGIAVAAILFLK